MPTTSSLNGLILNRVDSLDTYKKLKAQGEVKAEELWYTDLDLLGDNIPIQSEEPTEGDFWLDTSEDGIMLEANIIVRDEEPEEFEEADLWIDTGEDGIILDVTAEDLGCYTKEQTDAAIDTKISAAFANIANAEGGSF